jgi:hypothetical protein
MGAPKRIEPANDVVRPPEPSESRPDLFDLEVPAAVVCAFCGDAECAGCENERSRSGIVTVVAWERRDVPVMTRLWATAKATTRDAEAFFELLPDGPIVPAFRFALLSELCAASAMVSMILPVAAVFAPRWLEHVVLDAAARAMALKVVFLGIPALAFLLILAHAAHGLALDVGARGSGAQPARTRALRFGLYSTGWDLVIGPLGAIVSGIKDGVGAGFGVLSLANGLPTRAAKAFLRGAYRLEGSRAKKALGASYLAAVIATLVGAVAIIGAIIALVV